MKQTRRKRSMACAVPLMGLFLILSILILPEENLNILIYLLQLCVWFCLQSHLLLTITTTGLASTLYSCNLLYCILQILQIFIFVVLQEYFPFPLFCFNDSWFIVIFTTDLRKINWPRAHGRANKNSLFLIQQVVPFTDIHNWNEVWQKAQTCCTIAQNHNLAVMLTQKKNMKTKFWSL